MPLFYKSSEEYLKKIIRIASDLKEDIDKNRYDRTIKFLERLLSIDIALYERIESESKSKAMKEYALHIRGLTLVALENCNSGDYEKIRELINTILNAGMRYVNSQERCTGYSIEEHQFDLVRQAKLISDNVEGITTGEALSILLISYTYGLNVILGGSSFKSHILGKDIDMGFTNSDRYLSKNDLQHI